MILSWCRVGSFNQSRCLRVLVGTLLAAAGVALIIYGLRAAVAQAGYQRLKYGCLAEADPEDKAVLAERVYALYPHQYYVCELLADAFWRGAADGAWWRREARGTAATDWCRRGRLLNPYGRELAWIETSLAWNDSPESALAIWEPYVLDFAFWDAWNLAGLIRLRADAGRVESALKLLPLLRGRPEYAAAHAAVERAR